MKEQEIARIIRDVLAAEEKVVKQLRAEKRATGDYSKVVTVPYGDIEMRFEVRKTLGQYPPVSFKLRHLVSVMKEGKAIVRCNVAQLKCRYCMGIFSEKNHTDKYKSWVVVCDYSRVKPLFRSGDTLCVDNNGKAAFVKVEVLSEKLEENPFWGSVDCLRRVRLSKVLGHQETLAFAPRQTYATDWDKMKTYVADDSTQEFFGDKDTLEMDLSTHYTSEERHYDGCYWYEYTEEATHNNSELQLAVPTTEAEILRQLRQEALKRLLYDCRGEFCYGDPRVKKNKKDYLILGEETIDKIYEEYMSWLRDNCTRYPEDAPSGEFTGIAINYHGKENLVPTFDVTGSQVRIEYHN